MNIDTFLSEYALKCLVVNDNAIGLILALKAAYRFKDTEKPHKAEYMLMGTFLSLAITLAIGLAAQWTLSVM